MSIEEPEDSETNYSILWKFVPLKLQLSNPVYYRYL